jgi:hypothetical protein
LKDAQGRGFEYAGTALAFNPAAGSLLMLNHVYDQQVAEVAVPAIVNSSQLDNLSTASVLQPFADVTEGRIAHIGSGGATTSHPLIGGLLVYGSRLIGSVYEFYDVAGFAKLSHFSSALQLSTKGGFRGMYQVGTLDPGFYAGYMAVIPAEWQAAMGGPALTGLCCVPGPYRTSMGPGAFVFNPDDLGAKMPAPALPLVYYSTDHPTLGTWEGNGLPNPQYNMGTMITGAVFPAQTSSVLFFGRTGLGASCYGPGTSDRSKAGKPATDIGDSVDHWCYDPADSSKGTHAYPYAYYVWAYKANDLLAVRQGQKQPWEVRPYAMWTLNLPFGNENAKIDGVAYDPGTGRVFVSQAFGDGDLPIIHVFAVRTP